MTRAWTRRGWRTCGRKRSIITHARKLIWAKFLTVAVDVWSQCKAVCGGSAVPRDKSIHRQAAVLLPATQQCMRMAVQQDGCSRAVSAWQCDLDFPLTLFFLSRFRDFTRFPEGGAEMDDISAYLCIQVQAVF